MKLHIVALVLFVGLSAAQADVTMTSAAKSSGFRGMGAFEGKSTRAIQGLKMRDESTTKFTGKVMKVVAGRDRDAIEILRIDKDKRWSLNPKKKTYREAPISLPPDSTAETPDQPAGKDTPEEKPTHRIKKNRLQRQKNRSEEIDQQFLHRTSSRLSFHSGGGNCQ